MPVKFHYDPQFGLRVEPELNSELNRDEAMIVAVRDLAAGMHSLSQAMWDLYEEFRYKEFFKRDAAASAPVSASPPPQRKASAPPPANEPSAPPRKKPAPARSKKRRR
ncbi:MAG: hypothetical protein JOZ16_14035 [Methylobacteriaceae bacterium]|nr:hypothetical protein [Methylobacteriaceae bacterium]